MGGVEKEFESAGKDTLKEMKHRIMEAFEHLPPDNSRSKKTRDAFGDWHVDNSDPRLIDWEPLGFGLIGPTGSKLVVENIEEDNRNLFEKIQYCEVQFRIELSSGEVERSTARFQRYRIGHVHDVAALRALLEATIGEDIIIHGDKLNRSFRDECEGKCVEERSALVEKDRLPSVSSVYLKRTFWRLFDHLNEIAAIAKILEPLGDEGEILLKAIENRINIIFRLAVDLRQGELGEQHLADALRGKAVISGSNRGGRSLAERNSAHAATWKRNFGQWLQPLIQERVSQAPGRKISRDKVAELAERNWPKDGFAGLQGLPRQKEIPSRQTLLNALVDLEKAGIIDRKSPPRSPKPQNK